MSKVPYNKPALRYTDQLEQLRQRGLAIQDEAHFLKVIEQKSYYRLSGYWYPLLEDKINHTFKEGATFETAYLIYQFDRDLRQLIVKEIEKIEVAVRAKLIYIMSHQFGAFWYTDPNRFQKLIKHEETIKKVTHEYERSDAQFIQAFKDKYSDPLPPSWTIFEIISFGSISTLYSNLKPGRSKRDVAKYFGLDDKTFSSWLHGLVYVRNVCAHHSRLWNREMRIQPRIPTAPKNDWLNNTSIANNKTYFVLSMVIYLLDSFHAKNSIVKNFKGLLTTYPNIDVKAMGFPENWEKEQLWGDS